MIQFYIQTKEGFKMENFPTKLIEIGLPYGSSKLLKHRVNEIKEILVSYG